MSKKTNSTKVFRIRHTFVAIHRSSRTFASRTAPSKQSKIGKKGHRHHRGKCPYCLRSLYFGDADIGKRRTCGSCGRKLRVPNKRG